MVASKISLVLPHHPAWSLEVFEEAEMVLRTFQFRCTLQQRSVVERGSKSRRQAFP